VKLKRLLSTGLAQTAPLWTPLAIAYDWVHQVATLLDNPAGRSAQDLQNSVSQLLQDMARGQAQLGELTDAINHFLKVTRSYWSGLFHCYEVEGLPRTNNDLEHVFGQLRHHQRRVTGRKVAPASLVLRGSVRLIAVVATRMKTFTVKEFAAVSHQNWQQVRSELQKHHFKRLQQRCFRRDPGGYLAELEAKYLQLALPV